MTSPKDESNLGIKIKNLEDLCKAFADILEDTTGKHYYLDYHEARITFSTASSLFCIMDKKHKQFYTAKAIWSPEIKDIMWGKYDSIAIFALNHIRFNCNGERFVLPYSAADIRIVRQDELHKYLVNPSYPLLPE